MGWNDRLPEDPFIPFANEKDRDDYEAWNTYVEECHAKETGLTSQNVTPDQLIKQEETGKISQRTQRGDRVPHLKVAEKSSPP